MTTYGNDHVGNHEAIVCGFSRLEWNEAKREINDLYKLPEFLKEKEKNSNIYQTIDKIFHSIFSKDVEFRRDNIGDINVTMNQFDTIMNEIENETADDNYMKNKQPKQTVNYSVDKLFFCNVIPFATCFFACVL